MKGSKTIQIKALTLKEALMLVVQVIFSGRQLQTPLKNREVQHFLSLKHSDRLYKSTNKTKKTLTMIMLFQI